MASVAQAIVPRAEVPELHSGDRMTRAEFHRIYEQMPAGFKAELIGGTVYVASPLKRRHGTYHVLLGTLFGTYQLHTPGVESGDNATVLLGDEGEPQPDLFLRIAPEHGGQSGTTTDDYVTGAPELLTEIANSSRSIDLHAKKDDYARYGVCEYLVLCVREQQLRWFDLRAGSELTADADGIVRIRSFPGLWIDVAALLREDRRLLTMLEQGLATPEHAAFVQALADAKREASGKRQPKGPRRGAQRKPGR